MAKIGLREILLSSGDIRLKTLKISDYILGSLAAKLIPAQLLKEPPDNPSQMLIIRPGGIGDALFLLPIFKAIKLKHPQLRIDVLCQQRNAQVFSLQEGIIDHVFVYESLKDLRCLFKKQYDMVVDTEQWHYLTALTAFNIKAAMKIGFASRLLRWKFFNFPVEYGTDVYELENFYSLFSSLVERPSIASINDCFSLSEKLTDWAKLQIPPHTVTISIGASVPERRLSVEQMIILARGILHRGMQPVFLGGRDVLPQSRQVMSQLKEFKVYNFVGAISLQQSAALIKTSRVFIGTDSGLMHLACAVGHPVIALFGAGNMKKWMLQNENQKSINENVPCSPCTAFGYGLPVCRGAFSCLRKMDLEAILNEHIPFEVNNG